MANPFKKLKHLFVLERENGRKAQTSPTIAPTTSDKGVGVAHLSPISERIKSWIEAQDWRYQHYEPDEMDEFRVHHFVIGFRNDEFEWNCVIAVFEKSQLVNFQGVILREYSPDEYLSVMTAITQINYGLMLGNLDFDMATGSVRARIGFDGEFAILSNHALDSYMQGLVTLMERARAVIDSTLDETPPISTLGELLAQKDGKADTDVPDGYVLLSEKSQ